MFLQVPFDQPEAALAMFNNWISNEPIHAISDKN
jgi:carboxypeptidase C (cathepsin A)